MFHSGIIWCLSCMVLILRKGFVLIWQWNKCFSIFLNSTHLCAIWLSHGFQMRKIKCNQIQIKQKGKSVKIWIYGQALINHDNMISGHTIHIKCFPLLYSITFWSPLFKFHYIYFSGFVKLQIMLHYLYACWLYYII